MTRAANARIAGAAFLLYIAVGLTGLALFGRAASGSGITERLSGIAAQPLAVGLSALTGLASALCALTLAVTLYALTRDHDRDLALLASCCRAAEGALNAGFTLLTLGVLWAATMAARTPPPGDAPYQALGGLLLATGDWTPNISGFAFAAGSLLYAWLFARSGSIPRVLAWLGVVASAPLLVVLPLQLLGLLGGVIGWLAWMPMLVFEVWLALWLLTRGASPRPA